MRIKLVAILALGLMQSLLSANPTTMPSTQPMNVPTHGAVEITVEFLVNGQAVQRMTYRDTPVPAGKDWFVAGRNSEFLNFACERMASSADADCYEISWDIGKKAETPANPSVKKMFYNGSPVIVMSNESERMILHARE